MLKIKSFNEKILRYSGRTESVITLCENEVLAVTVAGLVVVGEVWTSLFGMSRRSGY